VRISARRRRSIEEISARRNFRRPNSAERKKSKFSPKRRKAKSEAIVLTGAMPLAPEPHRSLEALIDHPAGEACLLGPDVTTGSARSTTCSESYAISAPTIRSLVNRRPRYLRSWTGCVMRPNPAATRCWQDSASRWSGCWWLQECLRLNRAAPRFNACAPAAADGLLNLRLDENRELVGGFYGELVDHLR